MADKARITLVQISESDHLEGFHRIWSNAEVTKWVSKREPLKTLDESREWMSGILPEHNPDGLNFAVCLRDDPNEMVGVVGVFSTEPEPELGYTFAHEHWGKGYATEAVKAFVKEFWTARPNEPYITANTEVENGASQAVLVKSGFQKLRNSWKEEKGKQKEIVLYEICRPYI